MFFFVFKVERLDDLFILENGSFTDNWQSVYKKYLAHHYNHLFGLLKVHCQELNNKLNTESLEKNDDDNIKYKNC